MHKVQFNDVGEFMREMEQDLAMIDRAIVRTTRTYLAKGMYTVIYVLAGAIKVKVGSCEETDHEDFIRLRDEATKILSSLNVWANRHGVETRAGMFLHKYD